MAKISVVINTRNEEKNLERAIGSVRQLADEIVVCDMHSTDKTQEIAKKLGAKVFLHEPTGYVEPARNFALSKATGDWILVLDADEQIPTTLAEKLKKLTMKPEADFYRIPRLNFIFGNAVKHSRWWPDYNIRFFKKGAVKWSEIIHSVPETHGSGQDLHPSEELAIVHHHYDSLSQYLERMQRYTDIQARFLMKDGYKFTWDDLVRKPVAEFLSRFFAGEGYKDGVHGLVLAILQAFSEALVLIKVWEAERFRVIDVPTEKLGSEFLKAGKDTSYWLDKSGVRKKNIFAKIISKLLQ